MEDVTRSRLPGRADSLPKGDKPFPFPCSEILIVKLLLGKTTLYSDLWQLT